MCAVKTRTRFALAALLLPWVAQAEREMSIREFSDEIRARVVERVAEALGLPQAATAEITGVVTFVGEDCLFLQRDDDGLKIETDGADAGLRAGDVATVSGVLFTFVLWFTGLAIYTYYRQNPDPALGPGSGDAAFFHFA